MYNRKNSSTMSNSHRPMSIDAMLDMERQEVLALLENKQSQSSNSNNSPERMRSVSPYSGPSQSPGRSMLDIAEEEPSGSNSEPKRASPPTQHAPIRSMLDVDGPSAPATQRPAYRSMLDVGGVSTDRSSSQNRSSPNSPVMGQAMMYKGPSASMPRLHPRSSSDASGRPAEFGPRRSGGGSDRTSEYQFSGYLPSSSSGMLPGKRSSQTSQGKRPSGGSLADALRSADFSGLQLPSDRGRNSSVGNRFGKNQSKSPHNRWNERSKSPANFGAAVGKNKAMLGDGQVVDINSAYRRLSDANLAYSQGSLSQLPMRKRSDETGTGRLVKDYLGPDGEHLESSEDEEPWSSDDEDRGRKKAPRALNPDAKENESESNSRSRSGDHSRQVKSLLAAADEDRKFLS
jgi:hypothetical protein